MCFLSFDIELVVFLLFDIEFALDMTRPATGRRGLGQVGTYSVELGTTSS